MKKLVRDLELKIHKNLVYDLRDCFPQSFINSRDEFIVLPRINSYFILHNIENELELKCKVLEWVSRPSHKGGTNHSHKYHRDGLNKFLGTNFNKDDLSEIYTHLGNNCNRSLCIKFIESNYDMEVLERKNDE